MESPLQKAIDLAGGKIALALALGLDRTAVYSWKECPHERVLPVSELVGWSVTPHQLRPDLYPNPTDALPQAKEAA
jgi:DNA-binding transcriptional regulator YdaS (Cro superfamily)